MYNSDVNIDFSDLKHGVGIVRKSDINKPFPSIQSVQLNLEDAKKRLIELENELDEEMVYLFRVDNPNYDSKNFLDNRTIWIFKENDFII